jgi:hypothetical protein
VRKLLNTLANAAKILLIALTASAGRIARSQGKGVFETALQNAVREIAESYVRSVRA